MKSIRLRALTLTDLEKTLEWHNQDEISNFYAGHPFPINIEMEKKWYDKVTSSNIPLSVFGIEFIETRTLIGITVLKEINLINRGAEFAVYIGDTKYKGKGLSIEACKETLGFAFFKLGLHRIFLKVLSENTIAISLYQKLGFKKEGIIRESVFKNNEFRSEILMSILKNEYNGSV